MNRTEFQLKNGNLLFTVGKGESELLNAIQSATSKKDEIPFSHVGIVYVDNDSVFVVEASTEHGVAKTPIADFFSDALEIDGKPLIKVGRLKSEFQKAAADAPKLALQQLGKSYDYAYDESNNAFYCSELIRFTYLDSTGKPIFEPLSMSFKDKETGEIPPFWIEHFKKLHLEIPEGKPGSNPADLAKSPLIEIVYSYF